MAMNPVMHLENELKEQFPRLITALDPPADPDGCWFLDLVQDEHAVVVEWRPAQGFGVSSPPGMAYGEGPDEVFTDATRAQHRIVELLKRRGMTRPPPQVMLQRLKEELAQETPPREDPQTTQATTLSALRRQIEAMGGTLDLVARFPDSEVRLEGVGRAALAGHPARSES